MLKELERSRVPEGAVVTVEVKSEKDTFDMKCPTHRKKLLPKRVDYELNVHKRTFVIPNLWVNVCPEGEEYVDAEVANEVLDIIFRFTFPERANLRIA